MSWSIVLEHSELLQRAFFTMLRLFVSALILGTVGGTVLALMRVSKSRTASWGASGFMIVFRGIPALVILYYMFFGLPELGIFLRPIIAATMGLGIWASVYFGEVIRSGLDSVDFGQQEAAEALGLRRLTYMRRIIIPQSVRPTLPPYLTNAMLLMKMTSLASVVAVLELTAAANRLVSLTFRPLEVYLAVALIYMAVMLALYGLQGYLESRYALKD